MCNPKRPNGIGTIGTKSAQPLFYFVAILACLGLFVLKGHAAPKGRERTKMQGICSQGLKVPRVRSSISGAISETNPKTWFPESEGL